MADETPITDEHQQLTPSSSSRARRSNRRSAADKVRAVQFPVAMRGYERAAVDAWREDVARLVERLEEQAPRDSAVKRALDEVGKETTAILQRAHEAAEEITARSRSQADGRLRRAEGEAEIVIREADERAEQLEHDARRIWDERARLVEEMRTLADEVLTVADDALDRVQAPPGRTSEEPDQRVLDAGEDSEEDFGPVTTVETDRPVTTVETDGPVTTVETDGPETTGETDGPETTGETDGPVTTGETDGPVTVEGPGPDAADQPTRVESPPGRPTVDVTEQETVESPAARPDATPPPGGKPPGSA